MKGDRILVTGVTGGLGCCVARCAVQRGYRVRGTVRAASRRELLNGLEVELVQADLADPPSLAPALNGVDIVVHCAAQMGDWGPLDAFRAVNITGVEHLLEAARCAGRVKRWVHLSSSMVYCPRHHYGTEESEPLDPVGVDNYARSKIEGERVVRTYVERHGFPAVVLRPGFIYGPGDRQVPKVMEALAAGKFKFIGDGQKVINNTYVGNLAQAIFLAMEAEDRKVVGEAFNIRDERLVTRKEFIGTLAEYLGRPTPGHVPEWLPRMLVGPVERLACARGTAKAPLLTRGRMRFLALNLDFSIAKAKEKLGYRPQVDFQDGIREGLAWLERQGMIPR